MTETEAIFQKFYPSYHCQKITLTQDNLRKIAQSHPEARSNRKDLLGQEVYIITNGKKIFGLAGLSPAEAWDNAMQEYWRLEDFLLRVQEKSGPSPMPL